MLLAAGCAGPGTKRPSRAFAAYASLVVDPRAGMGINSGRELSFTEKVRLVPVAGMVVAPIEMVRTGRGLTESQFAFEHNLEPLGGENNVGLLAFMAERDMIQQDAYRAHLKSLAQSWQVTHHVVREALRTGVRWTWRDAEPIRNWTDIQGLEFATLEALMSRNVMSREAATRAAAKYLDKRMAVDVMARDVLLAERLGRMSREGANASLTELFWLMNRGALVDRAESNTITPDEYSRESERVERHLRVR